MQTGELWPLNKLVKLSSEKLKVNDILLIVGINFKSDDGGEITELALTPADAYAVLPDNKVKKGKGGGGGNQYMPDKEEG